VHLLVVPPACVDVQHQMETKIVKTTGGHCWDQVVFGYIY
jgi:hypothetical protein